jgi:hypothetical protein
MKGFTAPALAAADVVAAYRHSRASDPTHETSAGPSGACSAPEITPISESCFVTANTSPAESAYRSPAGQTGSDAGPRRPAPA